MNKAIVVEPEQMIVILEELDTPETLLEWTLTLVHATTALRPECFGLKWSDIVLLEEAQIQTLAARMVKKEKETPGKNGGSMTQVPMHPLVAERPLTWRKESLYHKDDDWVFASAREKGRIPRSASTAAKDYLRPAIVKAGVIPREYKGRCGWHNLRHSLATYLGANEVNLPVIQSILRHAKPSTTALYTHGVNSAQSSGRASTVPDRDRNDAGKRMIVGLKVGFENPRLRGLDLGVKPFENKMVGTRRLELLTSTVSR